MFSNINRTKIKFENDNYFYASMLLSVQCTSTASVYGSIIANDTPNKTKFYVKIKPFMFITIFNLYPTIEKIINIVCIRVSSYLNNIHYPLLVKGSICFSLQ